MAAADPARIRRAVEWLIRNPTMLETIEWLAETESGADAIITVADEDAAHRYLRAAALGRCPRCFGQIARWPDSRILDFPSFKMHVCEAL